MMNCASPLTRFSLRQRLTLGAAFLALGLILYSTALNNPFQFDDRHGIENNHFLRDPGILKHVFSYWGARVYFAPNEPTASHYRPLLLISYLFNFQTTGERMWGFHLFNLMLHVIGSLLVVALGRRLGLSASWATVAGLLFLMLPFQSEAVNYITARSSTMSGVFMMAGLYLFIRSRQGVGWARLASLAGAFAMGLCGVLTKEVAVVTPVLFFLYDLVFPPPREERWGIHGYSLHFLLVGLAVGFLVAIGQFKYLLGVVSGTVGTVRGVGENLWLVAMVLVRFLKLMLLPTGLSVVHAFPPAKPSPQVFLCIAILLAVSAMSVVLWRRVPLVAFGWGVFLVSLAPTTLLPMNTPLQESRGYMAAVGILLAVCGLLARWQPDPRVRRVWVPGAVVLALFAADVQARNVVWSSDLLLWRDAVAKAPGDFRAHANLGTALQMAGDLEQAVVHYRMAIAIYPQETSVHSDLGSALERMDDLDGAEAELKEAIHLYPRYAPAHFNLGVVYDRKGDLAAARVEYEEAIHWRPHNPQALVNLGIVLARGGDLGGGIKSLEQALQQDPAKSQAYVNLMIAYQFGGRLADARALYATAQKHGADSEVLTGVYQSLPPDTPSEK
ncbi:MAG: tetratricopeptide repeat protein [Nitrospirota bacterium]|nr:tetratricopeptide repeat protein [Nitrospirota bacterium]